MTIFWLKTRCGWTEFDERRVIESDSETTNKAGYENTKQKILQELMQISNTENTNPKVDAQTAYIDDKIANNPSKN